VELISTCPLYQSKQVSEGDGRVIRMSQLATEAMRSREQVDSCLSIKRGDMKIVKSLECETGH
jgi:hypothetical protein